MKVFKSDKLDMSSTRRSFGEKLFEIVQSPNFNLPSKSKAHKFVNEILALIFPHFARKSFYSAEEIDAEFILLKRELKNILYPLKDIHPLNIDEITAVFFEKIPETHNALLLDAKAITEGDPASYNVDEVILTYPGLLAIAIYRFAHELYKLEIPFLPRILTEYAHQLTGIDINPGAVIGKSFFIDHGTGIVIGETCIIGNNVKIYQGVTLGALSVSKNLAKVKRHPTIEDNVVIYSNATILGGKTVIGHDSVIGGNVWLTESVLPRSVVYHTSQIKIRNSSNNFNEPINFTI